MGKISRRKEINKELKELAIKTEEANKNSTAEYVYINNSFGQRVVRVKNPNFNQVSNSQGVKQDYFKAARVFRKACDDGNAEGCYHLGLMYIDGQGVNQDYFKAANLFKKLCERDHDEACYHLGLMYIDGQGVNQDYFKAANLFKKLCDSFSS